MRKVESKVTEIKPNPQKERLYQEAAKAWADPKQRLSKNRSLHMTRYVMRGMAKKTMNGKTNGG